MNGVAALVHHGGYIAHLAGGIHKDEGRAGFFERTIITTGSLAFAAVEVEPVHLFHLQQAIGKEGIEAPEAVYGFVHQLVAGTERREWFDAFGLGLGIPWAQ